MLSTKEKRCFVRHPICYPLEFQHIPKKILERSRTINISEGGLLFSTKYYTRSGEAIILKLPVQDKLYNIKAIVKHVTKDREHKGLYNVGVSFYEHSDAFRVKLIEQIYLIDGYRSARSYQLGREVSAAEASEEWIKKYSEKFEKLFWGEGPK